MDFKNLLKKAGEVTNKAVEISGVALNSAMKNIEERVQDKVETKKSVEDFNNSVSVVIRDYINGLNDEIYQRLIGYIISDLKPIELDILFNSKFMYENDKDSFIRQIVNNEEESKEVCFINENVIEPIISLVFNIENADKVLSESYKWISVYVLIDESVFEKNYVKVQAQYGKIKTIDEAINKIGIETMHDKRVRFYLAKCMYGSSWRSMINELNTKIDNEIIKKKFYSKLKDLKVSTNFPVTRIEQKKKIPTLIWRENDTLKFVLNYNKKITDEVINNLKVVSLKVKEIEKFSLVSYDSLSAGKVAVAAATGVAGVAVSFIPVLGTAFAIANMFDDDEMDLHKTTTVTVLELKNKEDKFVFLDKDYHTLNKLIPEKEKSIAKEITKRQLIDKNSNNSQMNVYAEAEQIKKLASLRDEGILTEEEFQQKKKLILGL